MSAPSTVNVPTVTSGRPIHHHFGGKHVAIPRGFFKTVPRRLTPLATVILGIILEETVGKLADLPPGSTPPDETGDLTDAQFAEWTGTTDRAVRKATEEVIAAGAVSARKVGKHYRYTPHPRAFSKMPLRACRKIELPKKGVETEGLADHTGTPVPVSLSCPLGLDCPVNEVHPGPDGVLTNILPVGVAGNSPPPKKAPCQAAPRERIPVKPPERAQQVAQANRNSSSGIKSPPAAPLSAEEKKVADAIDASAIHEKIGSVPPTIVRDLVRDGITSRNVSFLVEVARRPKEWAKLKSPGFLPHLVDQALRDAKHAAEVGRSTSGLPAKSPAAVEREEARRILADRAEYLKIDPDSIPWAESVMRKNGDA